MTNGNRYVIDSSGTPLQRDIDKLYRQYENLRHSIYQQHAWKFNHNKYKLEELREYIDEQFVVLTKEYLMNSGVDFPGYIKTKLSLRVSNSYVANRLNKEKSEFLGNKDNTVESLAENGNDPITETELYDYVINDGNFNEIQRKLLHYMLFEPTRKEDIRIITQVSRDLNIKRKDVQDEFAQLKEYIGHRCQKFYELSNDRYQKTVGKVNTQYDSFD